MVKRLFDIVLALILLIFSFPVMFILAFVIKIKMGSPVIFKQLRPGLKGHPFYLYKFRTMTSARGDNGDLLSDDERLTKLGQFLRRFSLDELPQILNIVKGDLSFVGPRPLLMAYLERYSPEQARRHEVKPGITGWAQVNGRNALSWEEKFRMDVWYVDNNNFWLDLKIIGMTVAKVLKAEGISGEGTETMVEFMGSEENK